MGDLPVNLHERSQNRLRFLEKKTEILGKTSVHTYGQEKSLLSGNQRGNPLRLPNLMDALDILGDHTGMGVPTLWKTEYVSIGKLRDWGAGGNYVLWH